MNVCNTCNTCNTCDICFYDYFLLVTLECKHSMCYKCYPLLKECPFCRRKISNKYYDIDNIFNIVDSNYDKILDVLEEFENHKFAPNIMDCIFDKICYYLSFHHYPENLYVFYCLIKFFKNPERTKKLMISYNFSDHNLKLHYLYKKHKKRYIFTSTLTEFVNGKKFVEECGLSNLINNRQKDIMKVIEFGKININSIDACETIVDLEDYRMNVMQLYIYFNDGNIDLKNFVSLNKLDFIAKCHKSLYDGLDKNIYDIAKHFGTMVYEQTEIENIMNQIENEPIYQLSIEYRVNSIVNIIQYKKSINKNYYIYMGKESKRYLKYILANFDKYNILLKDNNYVYCRKIKVDLINAHYKEKHIIKTIEIYITPDTIDKKIKAEIYPLLNFKLYQDSNLTLKYKNIELKNIDIMDNFKNITTLECFCYPITLLHLFAKINEVVIDFDIYSNKKIISIKNIIRDIVGIQSNNQRLMLNKITLDVDANLDHYNILNDTMINIEII